MPSPTPPPHLHQTLRPSPDPSSVCPPSLGADTSTGPMPPRASGARRRQVDVPTWDNAMLAGDEDDTLGGASDTDEMAVDPTRDEEEGSEYVPDGHISTSDGMHLQTLDVNASEEDDLRVDDHQDDRVDDNEEGDELRSPDDGEGSVMDLATRGLACDPDVPLPLNRLVSPAASRKFCFTRMGDQGGREQEPNPIAGCPGGYGSVDVFSWCTVAWEPVSAEEGDLDHPPGTSRPDARASATQGVVKPDRVTANRAPGAPGKDEALWELVYFFDNMDNPAGSPRKETGDPRFTQQHLVATFMDPILFARGMVAPQACLPSRGYEVLAPSLTVPHPTQFFQGIAEQGYVWQNVPYGINFTGDIGVYGRSGMFQSWGKAQLGLVCVHAGEPRPAYMTQPVRAGHPAPTQEFPVFSRFVCEIPVKECLCLCHLGRTDNHFRSKMIDPTLFQLFWVAGFPTRTSLAADLGIRAYVADPQPPSPAHTAAGEAHASPRSAMGVSGPQPASMPSRPLHTPLRAGHLPVLSRPSVGTSTPRRRDCTAPPTPTGPSSAGRPARDATPLWLPVGWPNVCIPDVPDPLHQPPRLCATRGQTCVVELPPLRHTQSPLPVRHLSKRARSASGGPPGEDAQAVRSSEPHPIAGGRLTPPFDTLNLALLHVVQCAACSGGLSPGEHWDPGARIEARGCYSPARGCPRRSRPTAAGPPTLGRQVDVPTWDHAMLAGDEDDTLGGASDTDEMAVDPTRDEEEGSEYVPDGHISMSDGTHLQTLDVNASEEDDLRADDHQDDRVDDDEEGDELRSADDGEGSVMDLATCRLACDPDVPLPLNGLVSPFPLEGRMYIPGTMDDLISVTCRLAQNFASQGWATKEGVSKSQIPLQDVLGVMYGSVDVFSWRTVTWEPVSAEEGDLDHPPGTSRPDACASATQDMVKPDRVMANRAPGAPGKDEALWELVYFFDNMDNPAGAPRKETGDPRFTQQHLVATFMDLILFACGMAAPRARLPSRGHEALAPSLTVPHPTQFFQGIAEQGDIGVYGRSGMFQSWGKAQRGAWFAVLCHDDLDQRPGLVCVHAGEPRPAYMIQPVRAGHPVPTQEFPVFSRFVCKIPVKECLCLCHLRRAENHFRSKMIDPTLFQLFWAAGFPTRTGLAANLGIWAYVADPQPPSPAHTAAGEAHASPRSAVGVSGPQPASMPSRPLHTPLHAGHSPVLSRPSIGTSTPRRRDCTALPPAPTGPSSARLPARDAVPLWLPVGWPNVCIPDVPDPLLSSPAPTPRLCATRGRTCVVELPPLRHTQSPLPARRLSKRARSASGGPPGEDVQAVRSSEPHPIAGGRLTPPFNTLDLALLHVVQCAACSGGLSPGERECVVARLCGMPVLPQGFLGVVMHLRSLMDQTLLAPWDFDPQGDGVLPWLLPWVHVLISWVRKDMRVAPGSDHRGAIVNMYLELSRTEWWALSDRREVLSEWCKGASMPV
ncbi:hypothetical protein K439DRAFT_1615439 [Ramaria rubella]|nr:hypothetical protein K439DRAFT_1615439 [Ramaria rubella]